MLLQWIIQSQNKKSWCPSESCNHWFYFLRFFFYQFSFIPLLDISFLSFYRWLFPLVSTCQTVLFAFILFNSSSHTPTHLPNGSMSLPVYVLVSNAEERTDCHVEHSTFSYMTGVEKLSARPSSTSRKQNNSLLIWLHFVDKSNGPER